MSKSPRAASFSKEWKQNLETVQSYLVKAQKRMKRFADQNCRFVEYQVGDKVMVKILKRYLFAGVHDPRLLQKYIGPLSIERRIAKVAYRVDTPAWWKIHPVFYVSLLKPFREDTKDPSRSQIIIPSIRGPNSTGKRRVEAILDDRVIYASRKDHQDIVNGYVKAGDLVVGRQLFDAMPKRNLVGWNVMMTGYLDSHNPGKCLKLFREMAERGLKGNDVTIVIALITVCARSSRFNEGKSVHAPLIKVCKDLNLIISTTLIHLYSRCGTAEIARLLFDRMSVKNIVCWNAMILGYCIHGNPKDGLNLYADLVSSRLEDTEINRVKNMEQVEEDRVHRDEITFVSVLCACAREGLLTEARTHFGDMSDVFGVKPNFVHYWCMANLLAHVGLMQEAIQILKNIPIESNLPLESSLCSELLGSARFRGDVILGEQISNKLIEQDPENFRYYLLLLCCSRSLG
uniref:Pentatricopeptide repeat-containing protein At3g51320-like n=1 Tax=Nicotiana sylvestris TaxID=4096 RepID=A0A1U7YQC5_NICSY|nr:PREDICTED: pentatricopeptide repeat-containing protein At3g51320-like [Nicotiana sylvestris]